MDKARSDVKIIDFGLAKKLDKELLFGKHLDEESGTLIYQPPE
jgi:serine/threonine protein kinase